MTVISKVLVANRGEIAARVMRTARKLGYRTVAVYSEADANAYHVQQADQAVCIGPAPVGQSYLVIDKIIAAAKKTGADAIHPGYGFLSENADFARACEAANIEFIGPPVDAIHLMGSKRLSKIAMLEAGVPCIPGYEGTDQSDENLISEAKKIGFPLMVKASAGGGGRGMRLVWDEAELPAQISTARSEAENAFGSGELILERAVMQPRHIEIQVFADKQGNTVYLGERDCSIQRRHQKVVEECPSPFVDEDLRKAMGEAAVNTAKSCQYVGAGTVEFLVDAEKNFYFLEMNTRLQVEHPVTELVTNTDLVEWQLRVAAGENLPLTQDEISLNGHAIEVRLYAEDPGTNFMPQTGLVELWKPAVGEGIRMDYGIQTGQEVSPHYDSMLAKVIAYGCDREHARRRLINAVEDTVLLGLKTNKDFLANILRHQAFISGEATTAFIGEDFGDDPSLTDDAPDSLITALSTALLYASSAKMTAQTDTIISWSNSPSSPVLFKLLCGEHKLDTNIAVTNQQTQDTFSVNVGEDNHVIQILDINDTVCTYVCDNMRETLHFVQDDNRIFLDTPRGYAEYIDNTHAPAAGADGAGSGRVVAPMDGAMIEVMVEVGQTVELGQPIAILEAMKMEHQIKADVNGTITEVNVAKGDQVKVRQLLIQIQSDEDQEAE